MTERKKRHENEHDVFFVRAYDAKWCVDGPVGGLYGPFVTDTPNEAERWRDRLHDVWYEGILEGRRRQARGVLAALGASDFVTVRIDKP